MGQEIIATIQFFLIRKNFVFVSCKDYLVGMLGEQEKRLVNHKPQASDLQAFLLYS